VSLNQNKQLFAPLLMASACHWPFTGDFSQCLACEYGAQSASASENGTQDQTPEAIGMFEVLRLLLYLIIINTCSAAHGETKDVDVDGAS